MKAALLCLLLVSCAGVDKKPDACAAAKDQAAVALHAVDVCTSFAGCALSVSDLMKVHALVTAASKCP